MTDADVDEVDACPECDSTDTQRRSGGTRAPKGRGDAVFSPLRWGCGNCGAAFDEPHRRPAKNDGGGSTHGLAKQLLDADPDEVTAGD